MDEKIFLSFWSGVGSVTGANFLLEHPRLKILVDCGLVQDSHNSFEKNHSDFGYDPASIDFLFVTHAHIDHIGRIPKLVHDGFRGTIYSTPETKDITVLMLQDAYKVMEVENREKGTMLLYDKEDIGNALNLWKSIHYHEKMELPEGFSVYPKDAGHILGSAMYEFSFGGNLPAGGQRKIVFTGDLGNSPTPLLRDTEAVKDANYMVMESVYGDRNHESKDDRDKKFAEVLKRTIARGGAIIIPAFSLERTQVILYELNKLVESGQIPSIPVFLDSPLAIKVTAIYERVSKYFNEGVKKEIAGGDDIFEFPRLKFSLKSQDSLGIDRVPNPKIILAGSGMSTGGRVMHHEVTYLPDPQSTICLMGYQSLGTLGRALQDGAKEVQIYGNTVPVRAKVEMIEGYSSHKDSDHLVEFVSETKDSLKQVFVAMGEPKASLFLVQRLRDYLGVNAIMPERGKRYELN